MSMASISGVFGSMFWLVFWEELSHRVWTAERSSVRSCKQKKNVFFLSIFLSFTCYSYNENDAKLCQLNQKNDSLLLRDLRELYMFCTYIVLRNNRCTFHANPWTNSSHALAQLTRYKNNHRAQSPIYVHRLTKVLDRSYFSVENRDILMYFCPSVYR